VLQGIDEEGGHVNDAPANALFPHHANPCQVNLSPHVPSELTGVQATGPGVLRQLKLVRSPWFSNIRSWISQNFP